ncbi:MAG: SH3 domain-containing protein [Oscillospiraceae bacterium]|nr:SH3 domain-containing protein [Oscillospiraceae bacterium]
MLKRTVCLLLSALMIVSLLSFGVSADEVMTISEDAITILKAEEGFSSKPYWDYAQWTVGYGTKCPDDMLEYYKEYGITEAEADSLFRTYLTRFEAEIHKFTARTGTVLTQNQFDALLLCTYNCGSGWSYSTDGLFYQAIVSGATGNELIYAFSRWCSAGGQILQGLLRRRLCEANMYLNGQYSNIPPQNFGYVLYDACGGTTSPTVQGYDAALTAEILSVPTWEGHTFNGWYTAKNGGTKVTVLDSTVLNTRLYAHWTDSQGNDLNQEQEPEGVQITVTGTVVNIRSGAGTEYSIVGSAKQGDSLTVTETAKGGEYTWGKIPAGWICLEYTDYYEVIAQQKPESGEGETAPTEPEETTPPETTEPTVPETEPEETVPPETTKTRMGTVKVADTLRIRSGPSTGYTVTGYLENGARVEILEQQIAGAMIWGRIDKGWISLSYVVLDKEAPEAKPEPEPEVTPEQKPEVLHTGTVKVVDFLRVRSGPGTDYSVAGYLSNGDKVSILETKDSGSMTWGKIDKGWISLDYVVLDPKETEKPAQTLTGKIDVNDFLRIRTGPGTSYAIAGFLAKDAKVTILEQKTVGSTTWGKIYKGWISMDYVILDNQKPADNKVMKTVTADCLRVRSNAGTGYTIVDYLYEGTKVEILETKLVGNTQWGRIAQGWISMDYVK